MHFNRVGIEPHSLSREFEFERTIIILSIKHQQFYFYQ